MRKGFDKGRHLLCKGDVRCISYGIGVSGDEELEGTIFMSRKRLTVNGDVT
jgi:hypothetical protein